MPLPMRTYGRSVPREVVCRSVPLIAALVCMMGCAAGDESSEATNPPRCSGRSYEKLHDFDDVTGKYPLGSLAEGSDGTLYVTATQGGTYGKGLLVSINPDGTGFTAIHQFDSANGEHPRDLLWVSGGTLYGTVQHGAVFGRGAVYKLQADGNGFQLLHSFDGTDGYQPFQGLIQGADGALYGVTPYGGAYQEPWPGRGVVFKVNTDGSGFTKLHDFGPDGSYGPYGPLLRGSDGVFYGTTAMSGPYGISGLLFGSIFRINGDGSGYTTIHDFDGTSGAHARSGLIEGTDGALYGVTQQGGKYYRLPGVGDSGFVGYGVIFRVNRDGSGFAVLHDFDATGGERPIANGLVQGLDGELYGTTPWGGAYDWGVIYRLNADGTGFTVLHDFDRTNGGRPQGAFLQGRDGALYGTTSQGGPADLGVVYRYCPYE